MLSVMSSTSSGQPWEITFMVSCCSRWSSPAGEHVLGISWLWNVLQCKNAGLAGITASGFMRIKGLSILVCESDPGGEGLKALVISRPGESFVPPAVLWPGRVLVELHCWQGLPGGLSCVTAAWAWLRPNEMLRLGLAYDLCQFVVQIKMQQQEITHQVRKPLIFLFWKHLLTKNCLVWMTSLRWSLCCLIPR